MAGVQDSKRLEQSARQVAHGRAGRHNVRNAVAELALNALRSRVLSIDHVASVTRAITAGIDPSRAECAQSERGKGGAAAIQALDGLLGAVVVSLQALQVAAREFAALGGRLTPHQVGQHGARLDALESCLAEVLKPRRIPADLQRRIVAIRAYLEEVQLDDVEEDSHVLELLASGALLGILETKRAEAANSLTVE